MIAMTTRAVISTHSTVPWPLSSATKLFATFFNAFIMTLPPESRSNSGTEYERIQCVQKIAHHCAQFVEDECNGQHHQRDEKNVFRRRLAALIVKKACNGPQTHRLFNFSVDCFH